MISIPQLEKYVDMDYVFKEKDLLKIYCPPHTLKSFMIFKLENLKSSVYLPKKYTLYYFFVVKVSRFFSQKPKNENVLVTFVDFER